jgi:SpoVK/Ycf46/Vps4 family AAA+-type ATPase
MGETAAKLRLIFDAMQGTRGVFLFDAFDALGGERASRNDVGEIRRVLNSFLQFLEHDESPGLLVAATNHPQILDRALFRRFDTVLDYVLPTEEVAESVMRRRLAPLDTRQVDWQAALAAGRGLSHGDLTRACEHAAKDSILAGTVVITTAMLDAALDDRRAAHE